MKTKFRNMLLFLLLFPTENIIGINQNSVQEELYKWKRKETKYIFSKQIESTKYFIALGFGAGSSQKEAIEDANLEAHREMAKLLNTYIKSFISCTTEVDMNKINNEFTDLIFMISDLDLKDPIHEQLISEIKLGETHHAAFMVKKLRKEVLYDNILGIDSSMFTYETKRLIEIANKSLNTVLENNNQSHFKDQFK